MKKVIGVIAREKVAGIESLFTGAGKSVAVDYGTGCVGGPVGPVGAAGKVYITGRNGVTLVLKRAKKLEVLAQNKLKDRLDASPALAGNQLFIRGRRFLYCIGE